MLLLRNEALRSRSPLLSPLPVLPSLAAPPEAAYRCPKLLEYLFLEGILLPESPLLSGLSPKLDGVNGGLGLIPIGEGGVGPVVGNRVTLACGGVCCDGAFNDGSPTLDSGDELGPCCCLSDKEGEFDNNEDVDESALDLNGWTGLMFGLRSGMGNPAGKSEELPVVPVPDRVIVVFRRRDMGSSREEVDNPIPGAEPDSPWCGGIVGGREMGTGTLRGLMLADPLPLTPAVDVVRDGRMNRSAMVIELGGDLLFGNDVRMGRLPTGDDPEIESRC